MFELNSLCKPISTISVWKSDDTSANERIHEINTRKYDTNMCNLHAPHRSGTQSPKQCRSKKPGSLRRNTISTSSWSFPVSSSALASHPRLQKLQTMCSISSKVCQPHTHPTFIEISASVLLSASSSSLRTTLLNETANLKPYTLNAEH